ncbi:MAG TPA: folylpolyglutamate synthase/dihydrofolate synthase family protein [Stellaceae bacterium]|nr:folylpolyglutamate synthase/dihydrofolate synthase family protein [Stellaceae bacterium]
MSSDRILERLSRLHPKLIDLALDRVERLLAALEHPERRLPPVIHIAGTNGKGSTVATLRACLEAAGYRVHVYTSPHLVRFAERIRVAGTLIEDERLSACLEECERANAGAPITLFEITTVAAFLAFSRTAADATLLEVGLGGRFDATNVVRDPAATVLTPISIDHQRFLGETVASIAFEKAGILKPGVRGIVGPQLQDAADVIEVRATETGSPLYWHGKDWRAEPTASGMRYEGTRWRLDLPVPALAGRHQIDNAGAAIACLEGLDAPLAVDPEAIARGLRGIEWPARLQRLTRGPLARMLPPDCELWLDGGHNQAGGEVLAQHATTWRDRPLHLVFGMLNTHDPRGFLKALAGDVADVATVAIPGEANSLSAEDAAGAAHSVGFAAKSYPSVSAAVGAATEKPGPSRILICGSLYLAGTVLAENG